MQTRGFASAHLAGAFALFDNDHLSIAVVPAIRANMVCPMQIAAGLTYNQFWRFQKDMTPAIALPVPANTLLW